MKNLTELFEVQRKLDAEIERKHPIQPGEDRLAKRILALQVELGELANELPEVFKFWSNKKNDMEKALYELVDCLHFILSIGLDIEYEEDVLVRYLTNEPLQMMNLTDQLTYLGRVEWELGDDSFDEGLELFEGLVEMLGFTWEQIESAYMSKNKVNWERQAVGY